MIYVCIRSFFLYWTALNAYGHLVKARGLSRAKNAAASAVLSLLAYWGYLRTEEVSSPLALPMLWLAVLFVYRSGGRLTFVVGMLAYGIGYFLYSACALPVLCLIYLGNQGRWDFQNGLLHLVLGSLTLLLCEAVFRIRRLSGGVKPDTKSPVFRAALIAAVLLYVCVLAAGSQYVSDTGRGVAMLLLCALGFLFFAVWRYLLRRYYMKRLVHLELESLRQELAEKEARMQRLEESGSALAQIIHRDNKLIPAMERSVCEFLRSAAELPEPLMDRGRELAAALEEMARGRQGILSAYEDARAEITRTGHVPVDAMLTYMYDRAREQKIEYRVKINSGFSSVIPELISGADAAHLLSDLIENAMIASRRCERRAVLVNLNVLDGTPVIEVSDSGAEFDPDVYQDLGVFKHSTHLDEGGSGIGLMDIWECKRKYKASLHILEYEPESGSYTKKIALVFDGKDRYLISSHRAAELEANKVRGNLYILPLQ